MFGVDMFNGSALQVAAMAVAEGITYPIFLKGVGLIKGTENPKSRDELFIIDRDGIMVFYKYYGIYDSYSIDSAEVNPFIREALNKPPTSITGLDRNLSQNHYLHITQQAYGALILELQLNEFHRASANAPLPTLQVYSLQGEKIYGQTARIKNRILSFNISANTLKANGVYFAQILQNNILLLTKEIVLIR